MTELNDMNTFFDELSTFELDMPGGSRVPFKENGTLVKMLRSQYLSWTKRGKITLVPTAMVPRLFLHNVQMYTDMQKQVNSLQKDETHEIKLFKNLLQCLGSNHEGMMVFPNINGRDLFETKIAQVEIDVVIVHPRKGVFVVNIKKQGGIGFSPKKMKDDMQKRENLVRMILQYGQTELNDNHVPIHNVFCSFDDSKPEHHELHSNKNVQSKTIIFTKNDLRADNFATIWQKQLSQLDNFEMVEQLEVLVARLVALSSLEGSLALIHSQMSMNNMQTVSKTSQSNLMKEQQSWKVVHETTREKLAEKSKAQCHGSQKKRFIIWTNDQLNIISTVFQRLVKRTSQREGKAKGLRLIVTGCKGSGKTMLLTFIAKMARCLFEAESSSSAAATDENLDIGTETGSGVEAQIGDGVDYPPILPWETEHDTSDENSIRIQAQDKSGKVLVCDGSFGSPVLTTVLQTMANSTPISVYTTPGNKL